MTDGRGNSKIDSGCLSKISIGRVSCKTVDKINGNKNSTMSL